MGFQEKALKYFAEVCIDKSLIQKAGFGARSIPTFVGEWLIDRFSEEGKFTNESKNRIKNFIKEHLPTKDQKEAIKNRLTEGESLVILDDFRVSIDLLRNIRKLRIPCIDLENAYIEKYIVDNNPLMLCGGVWGAGRLTYHPPNPEVGSTKGEVWLTEFKPMQITKLDIEYYIEQREFFTLSEWIDLLVTSMGYNPEAYTLEQKLFLLTRLIPIIEPRVNLVELSPKGTGKSYVYTNLSRYIRMVSGGKVTAAVLFYNNATNQPGLLTRYDVVVLDEIQTLSFDNPGEVIGVLKDYLESGRFSRGKHQATAEASLIMLANIPIDSSGSPQEPLLFRNLPTFVQETAFIDRLHGVAPGWFFPRVKKSSPAEGVGFKADFFSEILHILRNRGGYTNYFWDNCEITGTEDMRDKKAIERIASGYLKLLFPDLKLDNEQLYKYCALPAIQLRQRVRDQLSKMDPEYKVVSIGVEIQGKR